MENESALSLLDIVDKWANDKGFYHLRVRTTEDQGYLNLAMTARGGSYLTIWEDGYISGPFLEDFPSFSPAKPNFFQNLEALIKKTD